MGENSEKKEVTSMPFALENVSMKCPVEVSEKLNKIIADGKGKLQIITDYDLTITKHHVNGVKTLSSFGLLARCENLPKEFLSKDRELCNKYYPIESDPNLSKEKKIPFMEEWYKTSQELFKGIQLETKEVEKVVQELGPELRDGAEDILRKLDEHKIPVLILSAGLGNVIDAVLDKHKLKDLSNLHVVANYIELDGTKVLGYGCPENGGFLHSFNKNAYGCDKYFKKIGEERENIILMGDCIGDSFMCEGVPNLKNVLKIGFLYGTPAYIEKSLPVYLDHFDMVLVDDQSMDVFTKLINLVIADN